VVKTRDSDVTLERLRDMLARLPRVYGLDPKRDVMVLSPVRKGPLGTERLNAYLQSQLNPSDRPLAAPAASNKPALPAPAQPRPGDRVMQLRNDYEKEAFNGDLGEVQNVEGGITYVMLDGREVRYRRDELGDLALAYASTVHKVQGSEFPAVIVVLHASHHVLLSRALLYTAVTRAKKLVVIVGDERALARAVRNAQSYDAQSKLEQRLQAPPFEHGMVSARPRAGTADPHASSALDADELEDDFDDSD
jgi:exodeoxyribonuclease V alpha subunit